MASMSGPHYLANKGSTGNVTGAAMGINPDAEEVAVQFVVEAVGATPTVTWKVQGSLDGSNWVDAAYITPASATPAVAAKTLTAVGVDIIFLDNPHVRQYKFLRLVVTANTNVTYRCELYLTDLE